MKAKISVTDSSGAVFEGEVELVASADNRKERTTRPRSDKAQMKVELRQADIDFALPVRAFMNRYAKGRSGPQCFALLVARLAGGEIGREVKVDEISSEWNRVTGILGAFASVYGTRAKNEAWVDSSGRGVFSLLPDWKGALRES